MTIALNTELTPELIAEGYAREFVSKVQNNRKEKNFDVIDHIDIAYDSDSDSASDSIEANKDYIMNETLSGLLIHNPTLNYTPDEEYLVNDIKFRIRITKRKA